MQWFVVGLGIPFLGLALLSTLDVADDEALPHPQPPGMSAIDDEPILAAPASDSFVVSDVPLVWAPEPEYEKLTFRIRSGDTLDQLFRRNNLDIGNLAAIAKLGPCRIHRMSFAPLKQKQAELL